MEEAAEELIGAILQFGFAYIVVCLLWGAARGVALFRGTPTESLTRWAGIRGPVQPASAALKFLLLLALFQGAVSGIEHVTGVSALLAEVIDDVPVAKLAEIREAHWAILAALAYAFVRTGGSEELLFRGVVFRRLVSWLGLAAGNGIYACLFGLLHNGIIAIAMPGASFGLHALLFTRIAGASLMVGWYMEARDEGSLFMPWLAHGLANFATFLTLFGPRVL